MIEQRCRSVQQGGGTKELTKEYGQKITEKVLLGDMISNWQMTDMASSQIQNADLEKWLQGHQLSWGQSIANRAALRSLPYLDYADDDWLKQYVLLPIRALFVAWAAQNVPALDWQTAASGASQADIDVAVLEKDQAKSVVDYVVLASTWSLNTLAYTKDNRTKSLVSSINAISMASSAIELASTIKQKDNLRLEHFDLQIEADRDWFEQYEDYKSVARIFSRWRLWLERPKGQSGNWSRRWGPKSVLDLWRSLRVRLYRIDPNYIVWIDWYLLRLEGSSISFDIPGDKGRIEEKMILRRLAEATDEDFWSKGHGYVNATLKGWLDEARWRASPLRVAPFEPDERPIIEVPHSVAEATAFGLNSEGKLDPLPHYDQTHLRDLPNQRLAYIDVRTAALELQEEGQRLGPKLTIKIDHFVNAFPERFEDANAWPIWSAASALRTLYWKHKAVADSREPDEAKLEPAVAVQLRGFLDIYNVFAFGDDALRRKDENTISPQERLKAEELAKLSKPVEQAIIDAAAIRTEITLTEIKENLNNVLLAMGTPYADQTFDQANKTTQNLAVGLLDGARVILTDPRAVGAELAKLGIKVAATTAVSTVGYTAYNYAALIEFIAVNAEPLKIYAMKVFETYTHLPDMIDRIRLLWKRINKVH